MHLHGFASHIMKNNVFTRRLSARSDKFVLMSFLILSILRWNHNLNFYSTLHEIQYFSELSKCKCHEVQVIQQVPETQLKYVDSVQSSWTCCSFRWHMTGYLPSSFLVCLRDCMSFLHVHWSLTHFRSTVTCPVPQGVDNQCGFLRADAKTSITVLPRLPLSPSAHSTLIYVICHFP